MRPEQWETITRCTQGDELTEPAVALIVDSPWMPGFLGISTLDYLTIPDVWLDANLQVEQRFPDVIFLPGFWSEVGMAAEPSGFGCRVSLYRDKTPVVYTRDLDISEWAKASVPDPRYDGFMPMILNYYRHLEPRVNAAGQIIKVASARGPLTVATHLMGVSNFLLAMKLNPADTHRLLRTTTTLVRTWLEAQVEVLREVESVLVLDDIAGFVSPKDYLEFAHPYLKEIYDSFPGFLKMFHNDTDNPASFKFLSDLGIHLFNFTHLQPLQKVRELVGPQICLMGNVPPLDVLSKGTPEMVEQSVRECLASHASRRGLLLSAGGGTSPGTPAANIDALVRTAREAW